MTVGTPLKRPDEAHPLISVIIASYNREETLEQCFRSLQKQDFTNFEVILIDGGSTDRTMEIVERYKDLFTSVVHESDKGIYDAWNKGVVRARGEWLCFLGTDDYLRSDLVLTEIAANLMALDEHIEFAYSRVAIVNSNGTDLFIQGQDWRKAYGQIGRGMTVPHPLMMHRRSAFERSGVFDESFRIAGDYDFFLRNCSANNVAYLENVIAVSMRQGGVSSQQQNYRLSLLECRRAQLKYGRKIPSILWLADLSISEARSLLVRVMGFQRAGRIIDFARRCFGLEPYWSRLTS